MSESFPQKDETISYDRLTTEPSRVEADRIIDDWYLMINPQESLQDRADELLTNAANYYTLATEAEFDHQLITQKDKVDYFMRLGTRHKNPNDEVFLTPEHGVMAGSLMLELAHIAAPKIRQGFLRNAEKVFATTAQDSRLDNQEIGGTPKQEALKYLFDSRQTQIREKLKSGNLSYEDAEELFVDQATTQGKKFLELVTDRNLRDGELYEHYVEILCRFINWQDQALDKWYVRSATPREDRPHMNQGHEGARFATDLFIGDIDSEYETAVQVKLHDDFSSTRYDGSVLVFTGDSYTSDIRKHMETVVKAINSSYRFKESDEQSKLLEGETTYLKKEMIDKALES